MRQRPITEGVIAAIEAREILTGDGREPDGGGWDDDRKLTRFEPYAVVYPISGGTRSGLLEDEDGGWSEDAGEYVYQVTCVATTQESAERLLDDVGQAMAGLRGTQHDGLHINIVRNDFGSHLVRRTDDVEPSVPVYFHGTPRYRLWVAKDRSSS